MKQNKLKFGDFTGLAKDYSNYRPDYCNSVLDDLLSLLGKKQYEVDFVDVGAGTGIWTRMVCEKGVKTVTAIENNEDMRKQGIIDSNGKIIKWLSGYAEQTNLSNSSCDWVTMASSFHWANFDLAIKEFHRILRPRGFFTAIWNPRLVKVNPLLVKIEKYLDTLRPNIKRVSSGLSGITQNIEKNLSNSPYFEDIIYLEGKHAIKMTPERYMGCWRSVNDLQIQLGKNRFKTFLEFIENNISGLDFIEATYLTRAWSTRRKDEKK